MDPRFWTRLHGRWRQAALALGPDALEELSACADAEGGRVPPPLRAREIAGSLPRRSRRRGGDDRGA